MALKDWYRLDWVETDDKGFFEWPNGKDGKPDINGEKHYMTTDEVLDLMLEAHWHVFDAVQQLTGSTITVDLNSPDTASSVSDMELNGLNAKTKVNSKPPKESL